MSLLKAIAAQLGISGTATQNFTLTAAAADGTMKLARGNNGATTQDIFTVDAAGVLNATQGLMKAGSVVQALSDFTGANQNLTSAGFQKLPGGLIIQWRTVNTLGTGPVDVTLPIAYPNLGFGVFATCNDTAQPVFAEATLVSSNTARVSAWLDSGGRSTTVVTIISIGF